MVLIWCQCFLSLSPSVSHSLSLFTISLHHHSSIPRGGDEWYSEGLLMVPLMFVLSSLNLSSPLRCMVVIVTRSIITCYHCCLRCGDVMVIGVQTLSSPSLQYWWWWYGVARHYESPWLKKWWWWQLIFPVTIGTLVMVIWWWHALRVIFHHYRLSNGDDM